MKPNVGPVDGLLRILIGLIIVVLGIVLHNWWGLIGLIPIATGVFKMCPLYLLLKISTSEKEG